MLITSTAGIIELKAYYSNPQEFERLYKHRVDDYIKNKYPQFYNGK